MVAGDSAGADASTAMVSISNPSETGQAVKYVLGADEGSLEPGYTTDYSQGTQVIVFDRGDSFGEARYTLAPGTYRFVATDRGWDLHSVTQ
jgi:hypothetical protein